MTTFTRDQIEAVAGYILSAALDRIDGCLPDAIPLRECAHYSQQIAGAQETASMALAVLFAQTTGEGMGIYDWDGCQAFGEMVNAFVEERMDPDWPGLQPGDLCHPDPAPIAKLFADQWAEAMAETEVDTIDEAAWSAEILSDHD